MNDLLGDPSLEPTDVEDVQPGLNQIVVATIHYGNQAMILEKDVPVEMPDGVTLRVNVFRPDKPGRFPVVMSADVYGKDAKSFLPRVRATWPTLGTVPASDFAAFESPDPGFWVPNDYVVIKVALRGSSTSEGKLVPWTDTEAEDYYEVIEWAGTQPWSNGNVGTNGVSYPAVTQWMVAGLNPPHLKAMIPWEGLNDVYREGAFHGGIPDTGFFRERMESVRRRWPDADIDDLADGQRDHPLMDEYWARRSARLGDIRIPMYVGASWSTQGVHNRGSIEGFRRAASQDKWLEVHGRKEWEYYYARETLERQKRFFDHYLHGTENGWEKTPRVRLEVRERFFEGEFRHEAEWPIARTRYTPLYLDATGMGLRPDAVTGEQILAYDSQSSLDNGVAFRHSFASDTEVTGHMNLKVWVSADEADDMDLFVGIKKFDRHGREVHLPDFNHIENGQVATGWLRVSHRELDPQRSTPYQPWLKHAEVKKLSPGEIVPVEIEILPSSTLFRAGETLELVIKGSEVIPEPSGGRMMMRYRHDETVNKGVHRLHLGGRYDSFLLVPVVPQRS